jgi:carboxymethylenebutenolidase
MGYVVIVPEIFHEFEAPGTVLGYDVAGTDRGNWCKINKRLESYDLDTRACIRLLNAHPRVEPGKFGAIGFCIGGHLAFRAGFEAEVAAAACFYPTDIHKLEEHPRGLGLGMADDSLERVRRGQMRAALAMVWGRQDPHIPFAGRTQIREVMEGASVDYAWLEVNGAHAFMRDEGHRHDAVLEGWFLESVRDFFGRVLRH